MFKTVVTTNFLNYNMFVCLKILINIVGKATINNLINSVLILALNHWL